MTGVGGQVVVREATEADVAGIRRVFQEAYGGGYAYPGFFDEAWLKRSVFADDILMLVAEVDGEVQGTASVVFDVGAHSDLLGELGRLVVSPSARGAGLGASLLAARIERIERRLHVAVVENRTAHSRSQRISEQQGFVAAGFLPLKHRIEGRESIALYVRHFGPALRLRKNHPRVVPEVYPLAHRVLGACGIEPDAIVDEHAAPYPYDTDFVVEELTAEGLPALLHIERGRLRRREVFGPMRLQYGFFKLQARQAHYLIARRSAEGPVAGAIGFIRDEDDDTLKVFELIAPTDDASRHLLVQLLDRAAAWGTTYVEVDVSADAPALQRTLGELGFVPAAYVPAMVFHDVERLDVVRMVKLLGETEIGDVQLTPAARVVGDLVARGLRRQRVMPRLAATMSSLRLFDGLNDEQSQRVAGCCRVLRVDRGQALFSDGDEADRMFIVISGAVSVEREGVEIGVVPAGDVVGEISVMTGGARSATAVATEPLELAEISADDVGELTRRRPDIAVVLYRNLAVGLGDKLRRVDPVGRAAMD